METKLKHSDVTEKIIAAFYMVCNTLGYGFLEKVYHNALAIELRKMAYDNHRKGNLKWITNS